MNHWFIEKLEEYGKYPAIAFADRVYSYLELVEEIKLAKQYLINNFISNGEVVAIISDYTLKSVALFFALMENKNIIVPITSKVENEVKERLIEGYCDKSITVKEEMFFLESSSEIKNHIYIEGLRNDNKSGLIIFSSGSTGKPKAMIHDLDKLNNSFRERKGAYTTIIFLMFDHIGGVNTLLQILSTGGFAVFTPIRDADIVCRLVEKYHVELLPPSPTFLNLILISESHKKYDLTSLKIITYGTEAMPESLLRRIKESFPKVRVKQMFGTSETGILKSQSKSEDSLFIKLEGKDFIYKVIEDQLYIKSDLSMLGYLNFESPFTEDGWFPTGDLVEQDEDGFIKIIGRTKEVINVGGEKVLPAEIESVLLEMEEIIDVMAYAEQNSITGQNVAIDVVLHNDVDPKTIKKVIRMYCKGKLDNYKIPTNVIVVEKINFGDRFKKIRRK